MRLATFNILSGRAMTADRVDVPRFAGAVRSLLGLQEVDRNQPRSQGHDLTVVAAEAMGAVEHRFVAAIAGTPGETWRAATGEEAAGTPAYGVALMSRHPVRSWEVVRLPALPCRVPHVFSGRRLPVLVRDEARVAVVAVIDTPRGVITVATTHLSFIDGWNGVQLRRLRRSLADRSGPLVLMGDLNMGRQRATRVSGLTSLATALTFPADRPQRQLDHVLARNLPMSLDAGGAVKLPVSDHQALVVDLSWFHSVAQEEAS
jgi:endonuclease/exonuclease/phosphatase family metal-dependent hydrolase